MRLSILLYCVLCLLWCRFSGREEARRSEITDALLLELLADVTGSCATSGVGTPTLVVRATSYSAFTRCDLADGSLAGDGKWDLAFQRFKIATASGTTAAYQGGACRARTGDFDSVSSVSAAGGIAAPDCPFFTADTLLSAESGSAGGSSVSSYSGSPPLQEWYTYNIFGHTLSAKSDVYVIRSSDGQRYYKVQMLDYYSGAGTAGYPKLRYKEISL